MRGEDERKRRKPYYLKTGTDQGGRMDPVKVATPDTQKVNDESTWA